MEERLAQIEARFADLIWDNAPIASSALVKLSEKELGWKKSTTYTVLKKLCGRGLFRNENAVVTALITREEFAARQSLRFVEDDFGISLPSFLAAFMSGKTLTARQAQEIKALIDAHVED